MCYVLIITLEVSLVKFSYWPKFHVNIITGYGLRTIFICKGLTRNPEIGNSPIYVLPNISRLRRVRDTKFGTSVSNKKLLTAAKCQSYSFYRFWVIKGKPFYDWPIFNHCSISIPSENIRGYIGTLWNIVEN